MLLTLVPPPSCVIPEELQTHRLRPPPSLPPRLKTPQLYLRAKRTLHDVGIQMPHHLCADRALWWSIAVSEVTWDLESDSVEVRFVDGNEERWELDPMPKSSPLVPDDSDMEVDEHEQQQIKMEVDTAECQQASASDKGKRPESRRSSTSISDRLRELCAQLRNALEDVGLGLRHTDVRDEYEHLLQMAADPTERPLKQWSAPQQSDFDWAMAGSSSDPEDEDWDLEEDAPIVSQRRLREDGPAIDAEDSQAAKAHPVTSPSKRSSKFAGQLKSRRRLPFASTSTGDQPSSLHDYLSLVNILTTIRQTLLDLFSASVIHELKQRIEAPTYPLWAAESASRWCRDQAILKGAEVAQQILALLDDDGYTFDTSDLEEDELLDSETDEDEWALRHGAGGSSPRSPAGAIEARLRKNPMFEMRDDYALKTWCVMAQGRARNMGREGPLEDGEDGSEQWAAGSGLIFSHSIGGPQFTEPIQPWEVSKPYPTSPYQTPQKRRTLESIAAAELGSPTKSTSPRGQHIRASYHGNGGSSFSRINSPSLSDSDDENDFLDPSLAISGRTFSTEDPLDEELLPPRLPRALVTRRGASDLPPDMAEMRELIHTGLNEIAGLQKKLMELREFINKSTNEFESARIEEKAPKEPDSHAQSSLSKEATSADTRSPPRPASPSGPIPLSRQPLHQRAVDNAIANVIGVKGPQAASSSSASGSRSKSGKGVATPKSPRRMARENVSKVRKDLKELEAQKKAASKKRKGQKIIDSMRDPKKARREAKEAKAQRKAMLIVHEDEDLVGLPGGASASTSRADQSPVLGTFPPNSPSRATPTGLLFPPSPNKPPAHAFIPASPSAANLPPLTPPSSPPDNSAPPLAARLSAQELAAQRGAPRISPPKVLPHWQDLPGLDDELSEEDDDDEVHEIVHESMMQGRESDESSSSSDEEQDVSAPRVGSDGAVHDQGSAAAEAAEESEEEESDEEVEWEPYRPESPDLKPISESFDDIRVSPEEETVMQDSPSPEWTISYPRQGQQEQGIPRTPSSFPKSFAAVAAPSPSLLPLSPPPSATQFPVSSSRDAPRSAIPSFPIDPTLAALSLSSPSATAGPDLWSPSPLRPPFESHQPLARSRSTSPPPPMPREVILGISSSASATSSQEEQEVQQPATARAQAGARFMSRMLMSPPFEGQDISGAAGQLQQ